MALTRRMLRDMGIGEEMIDGIIAAHVESTDALKKERDAALAGAENTAGNGGADGFEDRYNALRQEFDSYRARQEAERDAAQRREAYRALLRKAGVSERRLDAVLRVSDLDGLELMPDGGLREEPAIIDRVRREWSDFIVTTAERGAEVPKPPQAAAVDLESLSDAEFYRATYETRKY